ncbi:MAG: glycoside hydrolase family 3 C-terminal domain-containing protein [Clostridia bacterium]|nr:glycoside hydrolase family 3 C-terminal domain-containing protein [Clostridia bacterium]
MEKWARIKYQPCLPLGNNNSLLTGCQEHINLSREAACEGTVLLKNNNGALPLKKGTKVAIFGMAQIDYVMCGGGAGWVHTAYARDFYEGLKQGGGAEIYHPLSLHYKAKFLEAYGGALDQKIEKKGTVPEISVPAELLAGAKEFTDTAIITLCRYSTEGEDRRGDGTDPYFELNDKEREMIELVCANFAHVTVVLNTGAMIDTSWFAYNDKIEAALMIWQGGMEGGLAAADVIMGDVNPSGKLVDTCAVDFMDYPSSEGFHESEDYVKYTEDIFVGYRYFETVPGKKERVVYPFGFGLSYTSFEITDTTATALGGQILVSAKVTNVGSRAGKEVVQVYFGAPEGKITKAARELCAFAKTKLLAPNESEVLTMTFDIDDMASYDDVGVIRKSAYVLEAGDYKVYVGNNVRDAKELAYKYTLTEDKVVKQLTEYCTPTRLGKRLTASGEYVEVPDTEYTPKPFPVTYKCENKVPAEGDKKYMLMDVVNGVVSLDDFIAQLTDDEMLRMLVGQKNLGVASTGGLGGNLEKYGIPAPMTADGPAGLRILPRTGVSTTAFPVETMIACTWNLELAERIGVACALECKENNVVIWLAPALNIHRSPLCGRNFEYFSEDPFMSGKMAAAITKGVQAQGVAATPKHFAANNKETNRMDSDSILSERALREIYLRGFEICVKESDPKVIMSSYNLVNGVRASECTEMLTGILREEWGYKGLITTDWWNHANKTREVTAGNDIHMPCSTDATYTQMYIDTIKVENTREELAVCVKRLLEMILWFE